jgi:hypothetical protein
MPTFRNILITLILSLAPIGVFASSLTVPFTSQAPYGNWDEPWQNACEEATIHMVDSYYRSNTMPDIERGEARAEISRILSIKENKYGKSLDESADTIVDLINNYFTWEAYTVDAPSIFDIKREIDAGRPIIVPTDGRELTNPFFRGSGPEYHTIIIVGYDDHEEEFITHEPGTRHGKNFRYPYTMIMNAMHDLTTPTKTGRKKAIFTRSDITDISSSLDGDGDGLDKRSELHAGSILWLSDSDGDGYSDGDEVQNGYSPILHSKDYPAGTLLKSNTDDAVYIMKDKQTIEYIPGPSFFSRAGRRWSEVRIIPASIIEKLKNIF